MIAESVKSARQSDCGRGESQEQALHHQLADQPETAASQRKRTAISRLRAAARASRRLPALAHARSNTIVTARNIRRSHHRLRFCRVVHPRSTRQNHVRTSRLELVFRAEPIDQDRKFGSGAGARHAGSEAPRNRSTTASGRVSHVFTRGRRGAAGRGQAVAPKFVTERIGAVEASGVTPTTVNGRPSRRIDGRRLRIAAEPVLPYGVAKYNHSTRIAYAILFVEEAAPSLGVDSENAEVIAADVSELQRRSSSGPLRRCAWRSPRKSSGYARQVTVSAIPKSAAGSEQVDGGYVAGISNGPCLQCESVKDPKEAGIHADRAAKCRSAVAVKAGSRRMARRP